MSYISSIILIDAHFSRPSYEGFSLGSSFDDLRFTCVSPTPDSHPETLPHPPCHLSTWSRLVIVYPSLSHWAVVGIKPPLLSHLSRISSCLADSRCFLPLSVASQTTWNLMAALFHFDYHCVGELWWSSARRPHSWNPLCGCIRPLLVLESWMRFPHSQVRWGRLAVTGTSAGPADWSPRHVACISITWWLPPKAGGFGWICVTLCD